MNSPNPPPADKRSSGKGEASRKFAVEIVRKLQEAGYVAYWAGGCVRDILLGKTPKDYDVATDARPESVRELFGFRRTHGVGAAFGVILIHGLGDTGDVEVATFRAEGAYLDGRRPTKVVFCTAEEDAQRRDFTINGMFLDPLTEQVYDYVGGRGDLDNRIVRAIGEPIERFTEDKLRLLRAIRFTANLGFELDRQTADGVRMMAREIHAVSPERITQELKRMLTDPHRRLSLELLRESRLLPEILPEMKPLLENSGEESWKWTCERLSKLVDPDFATAVSAILFDLEPFPASDVHGLGRRLKWSNQEIEDLTWLIGSRHAIEEIQTRSLSYIKRLLVHPLAGHLLKLLRADAETRQAGLEAVEFCEQFLATTPRDVLDPPPLLTGDDLVRRGMKPGPKFRDLLERVRDAQLELRISTPEEAWNLIQEFTSQ